MWRWSATCRERDFRPDRDVLPLHEGFASFQTGETPKKRNKKLPSKIGDGNRQIKSNKISLYSLLKELHERSAIIDMSTYITPEILRERWKELPVDPSYFDDCILHSINYIAQENYERKLYCFECEEIVFYNEKGDAVWTTEGSGLMDGLPKQTSVVIRRGRHRLI